MYTTPSRNDVHIQLAKPVFLSARHPGWDEVTGQRREGPTANVLQTTRGLYAATGEEVILVAFGHEDDVVLEWEAGASHPLVGSWPGTQHIWTHCVRVREALAHLPRG